MAIIRVELVQCSNLLVFTSNEVFHWILILILDPLVKYSKSNRDTGEWTIFGCLNIVKIAPNMQWGAFCHES